MTRVGCTLLSSIVVVVSLLTFPEFKAWMIAVWLAWHTVRVRQGKPGWLPLMACLAIVLVKRLYWSPSLVVLLIVIAGVAGLRLNRSRTSDSLKVTRLAWTGAALLWAAWSFMAWDWYAGAHIGRHVQFDPSRPIVCMGDSLTSGIHPHGGYPQQLGKQLSVPVINLGEPGITSLDALKQLPALVAAKPQAVVIELGGHDFLLGHSRTATRDNLEQIIAAAHEVGAEVVLMEIPRGFITDPYAGLERELARRHDLELVPDTAIRQLVLWSPYAPPGMWTGGPYLSDDGLHCNARGNQHLADYVAAALDRVYGPKVRANQSTQ